MSSLNLDMHRDFFSIPLFHPTGCVPSSDKECVSILILKICDFIKANPAQMSYEINNDVENLLGYDWSNYISNIRKNCYSGNSRPDLKVSAAITPYYSYFMTQFPVSEECCLKIKSIIERCQFIFVAPDKCCLDINGRQADSISIEGETNNIKIQSIIDRKIRYLGVERSSRRFNFYGVAQMFMDKLDSFLRSYEFNRKRQIQQNQFRYYQSISREECIEAFKKDRQKSKDSDCCCLMQ